ncbi:MAG: hypothetical protein LC789_14575 [Actinobacteria bacterium]|nr:hypothetical protein [Actinomycetota bacterium]MCA1721331.1 hypothetical protein [Actinomycetota bacterium]
MVGSQVYGNVWLKVLQDFVGALGGLPGAHIVRVPAAPYDLIAFGDTVLFPWRYARAAGVDATGAPMSHLSDTRRQIFDGFAIDPQMTLPYGFHDPMHGVDVWDEAPSDATVRGLAARGHRVVVVAYASNADALLRIEWGDAELAGEGAPLAWGFHEPLSLAPAETAARPPLVAVPPLRDKPDFTSGPLSEPALAARAVASKASDELIDEVPFGGAPEGTSRRDERAPDA